MLTFSCFFTQALLSVIRDDKFELNMWGKIKKKKKKR